jgi:hypothetical protein
MNNFIEKYKVTFETEYGEYIDSKTIETCGGKKDAINQAIRLVSVPQSGCYVNAKKIKKQHKCVK